MKRTKKRNVPPLRRIRTLLADDSDLVRGVVGLMLSRLSSVDLVGTAEDGVQALALADRERPELVLMDLQMPLLDGLEATRRLRARFPAMRVIIHSLHDTGAWKAVSLAAGADAFIPKLCLYEELPGAIARLFPGRARATRSAGA